MTAHTARSTREVLQSHLYLRTQGDLEGDLSTNYADDVVLLSWGEGANRGHDGVRKLATVLSTYIEAGAYRYHQLLTDGDYGMLRWSATSDDLDLHDGTDAFVVREGRIVAQTIAYRSASRD